ncbi:hypothetical protein ACFQ4N_09450 [Oceanobacillus iheyensis]|uniref:hypothetical protein n=1 Tax=Oceanobacillus iheyensis TaxID=182710 RepID=UPI0036278934
MSTIQRLNAAKNVAEEYKKLSKMIQKFDKNKLYEIEDLVVGGDFRNTGSENISNIPSFDKKKVFEQMKWVIYGELKRLQKEYQATYVELINDVSLEEEINNG